MSFCKHECLKPTIIIYHLLLERRHGLFMVPSHVELLNILLMSIQIFFIVMNRFGGSRDTPIGLLTNNSLYCLIILA